MSSMASSSTSFIPKTFKYDVFLSFRGEDTRNTFVDHLYHALQQKNINTYKDDEKIKKGKRIRDELFRSIEESRFYIIVFSKDYASSSWCLDELVKIMECQNMTEHTAFPVFHHVETTQVRKQTGVVGEAFARHKNEEAAGKWRKALKDASHLAGWELKNNGENKIIQQIVREISLELRSIDFIVDEKLVGIDTRINEIMSSLETSSDDVCMIGISGMGGAGKTTLARAVYDKISFLFEGKSFIENVREVSNSLLGLKVLQKQVLSDVLNDQNINVSNVFDGKDQIRKSMRCRKVLVVLDDVDRIEQLEALAGDCNWFKAGSRIIITTRDKQVLEAHHVSFHDVSLLSDKEAICLLSLYAFGTETPMQGYLELSRQVVNYASGLPLTIKVLGSQLCGANECIWRDVIEELKEIPLEETQKQLELSYNDLKDQHKEIFLDVACLMKGWTKNKAIGVLDSCGFHARYGLRVLELKSLVTISSSDSHDDYKFLGMHDHIEEMGRSIVRRPYHNKPHTHSRLWKDEEIEEILANDLGTEATICINWEMKQKAGSVTGPSQPEDLKPRCTSIGCNSFFDRYIFQRKRNDMKGFRKMENLRFLHIISPPQDYSRSQIIYKGEVNQYFSDALQYLYWQGYPFRCIPNTFRAKNLVRLEMPHYKTGQLWESGEREVLGKLKFLVLDDSNLSILDLGVTPNLEMLSLNRSRHLKELHMPEKLQKLKSFTLSKAHLKSLDLRKTPNLELLHLRKCLQLVELHMPDEFPELKSLKIEFADIKSIDLGKTPKLETLSLTKVGSRNGGSNLSTIDLRRSLNLRELHVLLYDHYSNVNNLLKLHMPNELRKLKSLSLLHPMLRTLDLGRTPNLEQSSLEGRDESEGNHMFLKCPNLQVIHLHCSKLETVSISCTHLIHTSVLPSELKSLVISGSENLKSLDLRQAVNLETLELRHCLGLVKLDMPVKLSKLKSLDIYCLKLSTFDLGWAPNLEYIRLRDCSDLVEVHMHDWYPKLRSLSLGVLPKLMTLDFAMTPNLEDLIVERCNDLVLKMPLKFPKLTYLRLNGLMFKILGLQTPSLKSLNVESCSHLTELVLLDQSECLEELILFYCKSLQDLPSNICKMRNLQYLCLSGCTAVEKLPEELGSLEYLKDVDILHTSITHLPKSIVLSKGARRINVVGLRAIID